jgi:uncharacterized membrane protein YczE
VNQTTLDWHPFRLIRERFSWKRFSYRFVLFFAGVFTMSLGIVMTLEAGLGTAPWEVFHYGLYNVFGLTIGTWSQIVGLGIIIITYILDRKIPTVGCILNMYFIGEFMDFIFWLGWVPVPVHWYWQLPLLLIGTILTGFGAGMYIAADWGAGPRDGLVIILSQIFRQSIRKIKTVTEIAVLITGFFMGGPVAVGTLIFSVTIGPIMQFSIRLWKDIAERLYGVEQKITESSK